MSEKITVKRFYDEDGLVNLIMDLLCTPEAWFSETKENKLEIYTDAHGPNVRDKIRDWLLVKERLINDKMMITKEEV